MHVARQHRHFENDRRALRVRPLDAALVTQALHAVDEDRLAADILAREIRLGAETGIHGVQFHAALCQAVGVIGRLRRTQLHRLAAAGHGHVPGLRDPLRRKIKRLNANVRKAQRPEFSGEPFIGLGIAGGADDPAPELRMPIVPVAHRNLGQLVHISVHLPAVDRAIGFRALGQGKLDQAVLDTGQWKGRRGQRLGNRGPRLLRLLRQTCLAACGQGG